MEHRGQFVQVKEAAAGAVAVVAVQRKKEGRVGVDVQGLLLARRVA
jgi:hypothetical protein